MLNLFSNLDRTSKNKKSRSIFIGSVVAITIAMTPYIFYTYKFLPSGSELDLYFFVYESKYQESISLVMWFFMAKFIPLLLLILWFFTCKHWWYHVILIPIAMYGFQFISVLNYESGRVEENEILYIVAVTMIVVPLVYFIRIKLIDKHVHGIDLEAMDTELQILKEKEELRKEREKLEDLQKSLLKKM